VLVVNKIALGGGSLGQYRHADEQHDRVDSYFQQTNGISAVDTVSMLQRRRHGRAG
jgi:hypothetical protein